MDQAIVQTPAEAPLPPALISWLAQLALLDGVPFTYLVADARLLPPESIRFFQVDVSWRAALLDGALSVGRHYSATDRPSPHAAAERAHRPEIERAVGEAMSGVRRRQLKKSGDAPAATSDVVTGFLLRSRAVSGWKSLDVNGYAQGHSPYENARGTIALDRVEALDILRLERLAQTVLLGLFRGPLYELVLHQPPEAVHFGVQLEAAGGTGVTTTLRVPSTGWDDPAATYSDQPQQLAGVFADRARRVVESGAALTDRGGTARRERQGARLLPGGAARQRSGSPGVVRFRAGDGRGRRARELHQSAAAVRGAAMTIIVPIHVAALRVSPSGPEQVKTALYDFSRLGSSPLSSGGGLIAADRFLHAEQSLNREPGIHLHWSLPRAYTRGEQRRADGSLTFPALPNRWLVTRFFQNLHDGITDVASWILEADAHAGDAASLNGADVTMPWMTSPDDLTGLGFHYVGRRIRLTGSWTEPGSSAGPGVAYLGAWLQAPLAYGPTFTAYYRNCRNLFGLYDDLSDLFPDANRLETGCRFTVSYSVVGWVSPGSRDVAGCVLREALQAYAARPAGDAKAFAVEAQRAVESELTWGLHDVAAFTTDAAAAVQGVLSGAIAGIQWDIPLPGSPVYPSALPDPGSIAIAIGNNNAEALSAYLNAVERDATAADPGDAIANLEWLLNALQFGRLPYLGAGEIGVGQLDEYLHARSFGSRPGGYLWTVRHVMTPGSKAAPKRPVEVTLPLPLAKLLSRLNDCQQQYDATLAEIGARQQKLFFDWGYHISAIATHVVEGGSDVASDLSGPFLLDGLMRLLPPLLSAGGTRRIDTQGGPSAYTPEPLSLAAPGDRYAPLTRYAFNTTANGPAAVAVGQLLDLFQALDGSLPVGLGPLAATMDRARQLLGLSLRGGSTAASYLAQAVAAVQNAQSLATPLQAAVAATDDPMNGFAAIKASIDRDLASLAALGDPVHGVFATSLGVISSDPVPTPAGQVYTGRMVSLAAYDNAASWKPAGTFSGIGDLIDQLTGQGAHPTHVLDTQLAGLAVATAFFWRQSGDTATHTTAYYLQMATQEIAEAQSDAQSASDALGRAITALADDPTAVAIRESVGALAGTVLPGLVAALTSRPPDVTGALAALDALCAPGTDCRPAPRDGSAIPWSLPALVAGVASDDWQALTASIETAWHTVLRRLPLAHQVSLLSTFLHAQVQHEYELGTTPGPAYWQPAEPVLLLAQPAGGGDLIMAVDRNGVAPLLPCRLETDILKSTRAITFPDGVSRIAADLDPAITGLAAVVQQLVEEAWLLAANTPSAELAGITPDGIAWQRWAGHDGFLPLFIFWQAEYVYSQRIDLATGRVPPDYVDGFVLDDHLVGYQPRAGAASHFQKNLEAPNFFSLHGVTTLSSATTASIGDEIRSYCATTFDYDPSGGPPAATAPDYAELKLFYDAYLDFRTRNVLSQGLSGFNAGLRQRVQELQLPVNVPAAFIDPANGLPLSAFWATQTLLGQSGRWPAPWSSEAIDVDAFARGDAAVYFSPLRAGFLRMQAITLVDVFGRFVTLPSPNPGAVAQTLQSAVTPPLADHPVYLPPRLVQPSRLVGRWISAASPDGLAEFTEWNPHPAASPICGWLLPNHLDGSLACYGADGVPVGSLARTQQRVRWFTVPGEGYPSGIDNRTLMLDDLARTHANPALRSFLTAFAYDSETADTAATFQKLLGVIDQAQQFIITKAIQEDRTLAVLIGQPLVLARVSVRLQLRGLPDVSLDTRSYSPWNAPGPQFQMDGSGFVPYHFGNFDAAGITSVVFPLRVGAVESRKHGVVTPYFDDGLVGFFVNDDYATFYTPVAVGDGFRIVSTAPPDSRAASVTPDGAAVTLTLLLDPRAPVHLTTGVLPVTTLQIPSDQYAAALARLRVTFFAAPVLENADGFTLPVPAETGYEWRWWHVGQAGDRPVKVAQNNTDAVFPSSPQRIVDGWLNLEKKLS